MKIVAMVKSGNSEMFVFDKIPEPVYTKYGNDTIIGKAGIFYSCFGYEKPFGRFQAFAGHKFDLPLSDGTTENCCGQWWDTVTATAKRELHLDGIDRVLVRVAANDIEDLISTYVYCGFYAIKSEISEMRNQYTGKVYEYYEYENEFIKPIRKAAKEEYRISITEKIFNYGFREVGKRKYSNFKGAKLKFIDTNYLFIKSKQSKEISELEISQTDKDLLYNIFGETVKSCCVKNDGEVYIENGKCINFVYKNG